MDILYGEFIFQNMSEIREPSTSGSESSRTSRSGRRIKDKRPFTPAPEPVRTSKNPRGRKKSPIKTQAERLLEAKEYHQRYGRT